MGAFRHGCRNVVCTQAATTRICSYTFPDQADHFRKLLVEMRSCSKDQMDYATAHVLQHSDEFADSKLAAEMKNELKLSHSVGGITYGMWVNLTRKAFRIKTIDFPLQGMTMDIPKVRATLVVSRCSC